MPRIFKHLEAGCIQVNLMNISAQINQLKYTLIYYTIYYLAIRQPDGKIRRLSVRQPEVSYVDYPSGSGTASYVGYSSGTNIHLLNYINKI